MLKIVKQSTLTNLRSELRGEQRSYHRKLAQYIEECKRSAKLLKSSLALNREAVSYHSILTLLLNERYFMFDGNIYQAFWHILGWEIHFLTNAKEHTFKYVSLEEVPVEVLNYFDLELVDVEV